MCFDPAARPPIEPIGGGAIAHRTLELLSADGTSVRAFEALAGESPSRSAMLVLPDARGLHRYYEELALRFAESGIDALAIDYFAPDGGHRRAPRRLPVPRAPRADALGAPAALIDEVRDRQRSPRRHLT